VILPFVEQTALHDQIKPDGGQQIPHANTLYNGVNLLQRPRLPFRLRSGDEPVSSQCEQ
jgi:hypothetical protein